MADTGMYANDNDPDWIPAANALSIPPSAGRMREKGKARAKAGKLGSWGAPSLVTMGCSSNLFGVFQRS